MENEVQQALAVVERDTGWLLNYRQLIRNQNTRKRGICRQQTNLVN
jgi:hypothetical protein